MLKCCAALVQRELGWFYGNLTLQECLPNQLDSFSHVHKEKVQQKVIFRGKGSNKAPIKQPNQTGKQSQSIALYFFLLAQPCSHSLTQTGAFMTHAQLAQAQNVKFKFLPVPRPVSSQKVEL